MDLIKFEWIFKTLFKKYLQLISVLYALASNIIFVSFLCSLWTYPFLNFMSFINQKFALNESTVEVTLKEYI